MNNSKKRPIPEKEINIALGPEELEYCHNLTAEIRKLIPTTVGGIKLCLTRAGIDIVDCKIHKGDKIGANTPVWVTGPGIRLPVYGHFLCFIAK